MWRQGGNNLLSGMVNGMIQFWTWLKKLPAIHLTNEGRCDRQKWKFKFKSNKASPLDKDLLHQYIWQNADL